MTLLAVVKDVCAAVGVQVPTSVMLNIAANRTMQEMLALANEMAQRIAYDTRDWTIFRALMDIDGSSGTTYPAANQISFAVPANYKRMLLTSNVYRTSTPTTPLVFVPDYDEWLRRGMNNQINANGEWMLSQGSIHIRPIVPAGTHIAFGYLDKNCIKLNSGGVGDRFMDDADSFVLDERLLKLGMTWQWKANKGTSYAEDMGTYSDALAVAMGHDSPAPIIMGRRPISANVRTSYPWSVPT